MAMQLADLFLEDRSVQKEKKDFEYDKKAYQYTAGKYFNDEGNQLEILDSTQVYVKVGNYVEVLLPLDENTFESADERFHLRFGANTIYLKQQGREVRFSKQEVFSLHPGLFQDFTGVYYNDETDARYTISIKNDELVLQHPKFDDAVLKQVLPDQFSTAHWWMSNLNFFRDKNGKVGGFEVNNGRVLHLKFRKQ